MKWCATCTSTGSQAWSRLHSKTLLRQKKKRQAVLLQVMAAQL
jgi:hypothetical protein